MKNNFKRNIIIGFGFSLLLLLLSSIASFISIKNLISSAGWVGHTNQAIANLESVRNLLLESETNQRGYLLTKNPDFLAPYEATRLLVKEKIAEIRTLTDDNPLQQQNSDRLEKIVEIRLETMTAGVQLIKEGKPVTGEFLFRGRESMIAAQNMIAQMEDTEQMLLRDRTKTLQSFSTYTPILIIIAALLSFTITIFFYLKIITDIKMRIALQEELVKKDAEISRRIELIQSLTNKISAGDYTIRVEDEVKDLLGSLSGDLNKMAEALDYSFTALSDKEWLQAGVAGINKQMLGEVDLDILTSNILQFVAEYTDSKLAALYIVESGEQLTLASGFAVSDKIPQHIKVGDGLVGQAAKMLKPIFINDIPKGNFNITFASGDLKPGSVIALPIMHGRILKGVMELGSVSEYNNNQKAFFNTVSEQVGISINAAQNRRKLQALLEETQAQSEELQMQHSEMENINEELKLQSQKLQVSEEELKVQQEELMQTNTELEERTTLLEEKNQMIEDRNQEIQLKAKELERTTKYKSEFLANMSHEL
ncbi:MAG: CHASE3 domain-containing protein, partial [Flavitalea sp.]